MTISDSKKGKRTPSELIESLSDLCNEFPLFGTAFRIPTSYLRFRQVLSHPDASSRLMHLPALLLSNPPFLSEQLRWRTDELRSSIIRANCNTQFAQTTPELTEFRHATAGLVNGMDDDILSESFRKTVHFTTYDSYAPFLARFSEKPCKAGAIHNLFAPGLPDYLAESSSTSGGLPKTFPKYNRLSTIRSSDAGSWAIADPLRRRTTAYVWYLGCDQTNVEDEDNCPITTIYLACGTVVTKRMRLYLDPEKDGEKMPTFSMTQITQPPSYYTDLLPSQYSTMLHRTLRDL
jgi:hypothetical protein